MSKKKTQKDEDIKPRAKHLNDVLMSRPAGRMKDEKPSRSQEKQKLKLGDFTSYD